MIMFIFFIGMIIYEIKNIYLGKIKKDKTYFKIFYGLFFSSLISALMNCFYCSSELYSYHTGEWIFVIPLLGSATFIVLNFILLLITLYFHFISKKSKNFKNKKTYTGLKNFLIFSLIAFVIIMSQVAYKYFEKKSIDDKVLNETLIYLKDKYGSDEFEVTRIDREFSDNGFIGTDNLEYYDVTVIYKPNDIRFTVELMVDDYRNIKREYSEDYFTLYYYDDKYNDKDFIEDANYEKDKLLKYLSSKGLNVDIMVSEYYTINDKNAIPRDYGKIPTREELYYLILDYQLKHEAKIIINRYELTGNNLELELRNYLIKLSNYIIEYYGNLEDYKVYCSYNYSNDIFYRGNITIDKEYIYLDVGSIEEKIRR